MLAQSNPALIIPNENSGVVQLEVSGVSNETTKGSGYDYLAVYVKNEANEYHANAIQGRHEVDGDFLVFTPYYPFEKGLSYVIRVRNDPSEAGYWYQDFQIGEKQITENARLQSIYPSATELPENLLRFYFYFNTPMKRDQALQHIHLVDAEGNIDHHAFMEFKQELWSGDGKRLTLLFDPGRIKRGVSTNMELGPALLEGKKYSLTISGNWQDVYGQKLGASETKAFEVGRAYRTSINVKNWSIDSPEAESIQPLTIQFDRIMDHALVQCMIQIRDENEQLISGYWKTAENEKSVQFIPEKPWLSGKYQVLLDHRMEDVAGNNLEALLDQKTGTIGFENQLFIRHFSL